MHDICEYLKIYPLTFNLTEIELSPVLTVKSFFVDLFKVLQVKHRTESDHYNNEQIKLYIQKRCDNLTQNPKKMIDSALNRKRKKIILNRVLVEKNGHQFLLTDANDINQALVEHFQKTANSTHHPCMLNERWTVQYRPQITVNKHWYDSLANPIMID